MTRWTLAAGDFTPHGGMDRANHALARYLALSGREVHLVAHCVSSDLASLPGVSVHQVPRPLGSHLLGAPLLARAAARTARRLAPLHLLSNGGNTNWVAPTWVHYLHAAYAPEVASGARARLLAAAGRRRYLSHEANTLRLAPAIICNSDRTAEDVRRCYGGNATRVEVVYYGIDPEQFSAVGDEARREARNDLGLPQDSAIAVFVGALGDRRKGFDVLFEAWQRLCADRAWDVTLLVVGVGGEVAAWERRTGAGGLGSRIRFLHFRSDIPRILAAADVLVHPARYEAYGLGVHEALCRGLPAIVSANAGVAERLPEELRALTIPDPIETDDLVDRLRLWRRDRAAWRARARAAGDGLRRRTWDHMAADITRIVERTV